MENLYEKLSDPFPVEMERQVKKGGASLTYIPISEVITRMNRIFGPCGWSHTVVSCERDKIDPEWVIAHVRVDVYDENSASMFHTSHAGFGGTKIKRTKSGDVLDLGDEFKGAVSDALKKACQHLGVGLYLARDADAIEMDEVIHAEVQIDPVVDKYNRFKEIRDLLTEDQVKDLRAYWSTWSDGRAIPKPSEFTIKELEVLTVEALRIHLGGTISPDFADSAE
jgi:hypothetical protein